MSIAEIDEMWNEWSRAVAYAESLPVGTPQEMAAWERVDRLWEKVEKAREAGR